ncbi:MAG: AAC(3) family N-acetyltransferase [Rhodospirillales bacterium]|nr:AAC(3) family N-acetyltransferase [Rhodospirillales bacterium]
MPQAFGKALADLGIRPNSQVLLIVDENALFAALPAPRIGGMSQGRAGRAVVEVALSAIGETGLLALPFDPLSDPKKGSHRRTLFASEATRPHGLASAAMAGPDVARSEAPILALAAVGKGAKELTDGQLGAAPFAMGPGSPWAKLLHRPVRLVMTRTPATVNYGLLLPVHLRYSEYGRPAFFNRAFPFRVRDRNGREREVAFHLHACPFQPHYDLAGYADFGRFMDHLDDKCELYAKARIGNLELVACDFAAQYRACVEAMAEGNYLEDARYW